MSFQRILVVCAGNICRSPMAEAMLQQLFPGKQVGSAGIVGLEGQPADPLAVMVMKERGWDISGHVARRLDLEMLWQADLVLTMSRQQTNHIDANWGVCRGKVFRIGHWRNESIPDPYQKSKLDFERVCDQLQVSIQDWSRYLG